MSDWNDWAIFAVALGAVLVAAVLITLAVTIPFRIVARRAGWDKRVLGSFRRPFRVLLLATGLRLVVSTALPEAWEASRVVIQHALLIAIIASAGWLLAGIATFLFARTLARYPIDVVDNRNARRVHTQVTILRRLVFVIIVVMTVGTILLTFPGVEAFGASILASAGLVSVVAGLAAQSTLANVFAGMQLAFSDAIRVDDVVVANGEWGRIEEITLTYVVMTTWDQRRVVLPSTFFTSTPFENWTRRTSELLGAVEIDVDWKVSPSALRTELDRVLAATELWDGRTHNVQVTDAVGGLVRVRVVVSAATAGNLWDLRCHVRERIVEWMAASSTHALPRQRVHVLEGEPTGRTRRGRARDDEGGLFSGSDDAEQRGKQFSSGQSRDEPTN